MRLYFERQCLGCYNFVAFQEVRPSHRVRSQQHMSRQLSILLSSLVIFGMIQLDCQLLAQPPKEITNSIGMKLVLIPKGTFMMGSPESEQSRKENETQHEVTISKDYYLGVHEVTQAQYEKVMGKNPSHFQGAIVGNENADLPVEIVSWDAAVEFCKKLSDLPEEKKTSRLYRLPTEAEWEYAYTVAAVGATLPRIASRRTVTGARRAAAATPSASAWP